VSANRKSRGGVTVAEAIYDLSLPSADWLRNLSRAIARDLGATLGCFSFTSTRQPDGSYDVSPLFVDTPAGIEKSFPDVVTPIVEPGSNLLGIMIRQPLSGLVETFPADHPYRLTCARHLQPVGGVDTNGFAAFDTAAHFLAVSPIFAREATPTESVRARYSLLAAHLTSAMRLRRHLEANGKSDPEAIFAPDGRTHHAEGAARGRSALEDLRAAVRTREAALGRSGHGSGDQALRLWQAMVSGRWSLLDRFESDGRRFVMALANENIPNDPRALTPREEQVAQLAGLGEPNGRIAYAVGISAESVSVHLHSALRKLRCRTRRDLIRMMSGNNFEFTVDVHGDLIGVIAEPPAERQSPANLTSAERRVFAALRAGKTNAEIAAERGTSQRTVANQVASILHKTNTESRYAVIRNYG
jgi:DNA-binding NarL/FixJ family response regulator